MERQYFAEYWKTIEFQNKILIFAVILMTLCVAVICVSFNKALGWQKVILVPPILEEEVTVAGSKTSQKYLMAVNKFLAQEIMEYTPHDIQQRIDTVLQFIPPKYSRTIEAQLESLKDDVMKSGLSQLFRLEEMRIRDDGFAYFSGNIDRHIAGKPFWKQEVKLRIQFTLENGLYSMVGLKLLMGPFSYKGNDAILMGYEEK